MATNGDLVFVQGQFVGVINLFPVHLLVNNQMLTSNTRDRLIVTIYNVFIYAMIVSWKYAHKLYQYD